MSCSIQLQFILNLFILSLKKKVSLTFDAKISGCSLSQKYKELVPDFGAPPIIRFGSFMKLF